MKKLTRFLYLLALIKFILPFILQSAVYEPHRDEFLYLAEGNHLAFGFMEVPPMLSVFAWITQLFGAGMFWIKFWPSLIGAFNFVLIGKIVISRGGKQFALFLLFCCFIFSAYIRVHFLFQPNFLEIFFYTVIAYGLIRFADTAENKWLYVVAVGAGLGLLSKYSIGFYLISLIPALLLTKQRKIFRNRHLYYAAALAFIIFLPNLIWQYIYHFPVAFHMHELNKRQLQFVSASSFLTDQLFMFLPCFFVWITGFFYLLFNPKQRLYIFLSYAYLGVIIILLFFHGKGYYALGLYPILLGFGSLAIESWAIGKRYFLRYVFSTIIILIGIDFTFLGLPVMTPPKMASFYQKTNAAKTDFLKWEDGENHPLPQDFSDMLGWEEMTQKTAAAYHSLDSSQQAHAIIFCNNYGMAGAINYYRKKYHLPEAYSGNASFLYWIPDSVSFQNFVLVTTDTLDMQRPFIKMFYGAKRTGVVEDPYARENGTQIILLTGANDQFHEFFDEKLKAERIKTRGYN